MTTTTHPNLATVSTTALIDCGSHRYSARSVSWSANGNSLGLGCGDRVARIVAPLDASSNNNNTNNNNNNNNPQAREIMTLPGHGGPVTTIRFHPLEENTVLTACKGDHSIRLWDCRASTARLTGNINVPEVSSVEWNGNYLAVAERRGTVQVLDRRKLTKPNNNNKLQPLSQSNNNNTAAATTVNKECVTPVHTLDQLPLVVDRCIFGPEQQQARDFLIGGLAHDGQGMSDLAVWRWNNNNTTNNTKTTAQEPKPKKQKKTEAKHNQQQQRVRRYPAHAAPIFALALSPNGKRIASGGADAMVSLWDTDTLIPTHTALMDPRYYHSNNNNNNNNNNPTEGNNNNNHMLKQLIRSVAFSHDSHILACSDEQAVALCQAATGAPLGHLDLNQVVPSDVNNGSSFGGAGRQLSNGAEELAWHPKGMFLACARSMPPGTAPPPAVTVAKLSVVYDNNNK